jgi:hypothetical protein
LGGLLFKQPGWLQAVGLRYQMDPLFAIPSFRGCLLKFAGGMLLGYEMLGISGWKLPTVGTQYICRSNDCQWLFLMSG